MTFPSSLPILRLTSNQEAHARFQCSRLRAVPAHRHRGAGRWPAGRGIRGAQGSAQSRNGDALFADPARRRLAREIFLDELKTDAAILPRIVALGDIDEDELAFSEGSEQFSGAAPLDIPPRLGELERRLTLAHLVAAWATSPVSAPLVVGGPASN